MKALALTTNESKFGYLGVIVVWPPCVLHVILAHIVNNVAPKLDRKRVDTGKARTWYHGKLML